MVLVAIDGSDTSMRAGAYAAGMARRQNARLVCLYVRTFSAVAGIGGGAVTSVQEAQDEIARELRQAVETQGAERGIRAEVIERYGNPFTEIVRLADELRADAVIVGLNLGWSPFRRLARGPSRARQPLARHRCPLTDG